MSKQTPRQTTVRRVNSTLMRLVLTDNANERHTAADLLAAMVKNGDFDPHKHRVIIRKAPPTREDRQAAAAAAWQAARDEFNARMAERRRQHEEEMERSRQEHAARRAEHEAFLEKMKRDTEELRRRYLSDEPTETESAIEQLARNFGIRH